MNHKQTKQGAQWGRLLALALLCAAGGAQASPWLSSPTSDRVGNTVEVWGGGFESGATIELTVLDANDDVVSVSQTRADPEGNIHDDVEIGEAPAYVLEAAIAGVDGAPLVEAQLVPGTRDSE